MVDGFWWRMRPAIFLVALLLAACTEATASRVDERTFKIQGPELGTASDAPNQRLANRLCPRGYRVLDTKSNKGGSDRVTDSTDIMTTWTIRCI
jgi:hypothetical protein